MNQCEWNGPLVTLAGPTPALPSHQVTIQEGCREAAVAVAADERSASFILTVRLVPSSLTEASRMSMAAKFGPAVGTTGKMASPPGSVVQFPGGRPCVPARDMVPPLAEAEGIATLAGVGSGSRLPWAANRLGPVRSRITATKGLPMYWPFGKSAL